ncbi:TPA: HEPN domain-containing protein [Serratia fonticola]|uniref:HEPN domain-containing protein n=1 Tax=Serratia fonticola TaxID=47917 RepID=UPI002177ADE2|nr:HEPN domain-containing protein [Serratia fonticola]CAI0941505.1 Uncharacterised protein [Serratia fonticola]
MNPNAVKAMKAQIIEWLDSIILPDEQGLGEGWDQPTDKLINSVYKSKCKWLSEPLINTVLLDSLHEFIPNLLSREGGGISNRVNLDEAAEYILNVIVGIPYEYKVFFEIGLERASYDFTFGAGDHIAFGIYDEEFIKIDDKWAPCNGKKSFYSVIVNGYIPRKNNTAVSDAVYIAQSWLKFFIERGLSLGILNKRTYYFGHNIIKPLMYIHQLSQDGSVKDRYAIKLPQDLGSFLNAIGDGFIKLDRKSGCESLLKTFIDVVNMNNNIDTNKIVAASGWRFDSLADPSDAMSLVKICIGLESIYGDTNAEVGLTKTLADRCAYSLSKNLKDREEIIDKCKKLYNLRSKIVHGVKNRLTDKDYDLLKYGDNLLRRAIFNESNLLIS